MRYGLVPIARPTFDVPFAEATARTAEINLREAGLEIVGSSHLAMDAASLTELLDQLATHAIDALVILQASFADSSLALQAAAMNVPMFSSSPLKNSTKPHS